MTLRLYSKNMSCITHVMYFRGEKTEYLYRPSSSVIKSQFVSLQLKLSFFFGIFILKQEKVEADEKDVGAGGAGRGGELSMEEMHARLVKDLGEYGEVHQCMLCPDVQLSTQVREQGAVREQGGSR